MDAAFFRTFQLNKKFERNLHIYLPQLPWPSFEDTCPRCKIERTFAFEKVLRLGGQGGKGSSEPELTGGSVVVAIYQCAACDQETRALDTPHYRVQRPIDSKRTFLLEFADETTFTTTDGKTARRVTWVRKLGQQPAWLLKLSKEEQQALGTHADHIRAGTACERESFSIGACAYYRRALEDLLWELIRARGNDLAGDEKEAFDKEAESLMASWSGRDASRLAMPQLPPSARPTGVNPLSWMYEQLSEALHSGDAEQALEIAGRVRPILVSTLLEIHRERLSRAHAQRLQKAMEGPRKS